MPERNQILLLAAAADCNPRTAAKALRLGVDVIKGANLRDRLRGGARELGLDLGQHASA